MEDDPFEDYNFYNNSTQDSSEEKMYPIDTVHQYWIISMEVIIFAISLANVSANLILMFVILRFKRMRTRFNYYLLSYALTNTIYYANEPVMYVIILRYAAVNFGLVTFCVVYKIQEVTMFVAHIFVTALAAEYHFFPVEFKRRNFFYIHAFAIIYLIGLGLFVLDASLCTSKYHYHLKHSLNIVSYSALLLILGWINFKKARTTSAEQRNVAFYLCVANAIVYLWVPSFVFYFLFKLAYDYELLSLMYVLQFTEFLPGILCHSTSIVAVYILGTSSKQFKIAFLAGCKKNLQQYETDELDKESCADFVVEHTVSGNFGRSAATVTVLGENMYI